MSGDEFERRLAGRLAALPGVLAVALGGSRAQGTARPDSDWDLAIYYRGHFDPGELRAVGWPGEVSELGAWGGGLFNGGAWLTVDGRRVDVHYRDLDVIDRVRADAENGGYTVEPLMFHVVGIPSYLLLAELAINRTLIGELPRPDYPEALRVSAFEGWSSQVRPLLDYAQAHVDHGRAALALGLAVQAAARAAHAVLARDAGWVTNDKRLLEAAGLGEIDEIVADASAGASDRLRRIRAVIDAALENS